MNNNKKTLALVMMLKNEHLRLHVSLQSAKGIIDSVIILDTGSTDDTIEIVRRFCEENKIPFHLKEEPFVDFSTSRNVLLDFSDDKCDYMVLLDCNDEIQGGQHLRDFVDHYNGPSSSFHICQQWFNGVSIDKYYNTRLIKTKHNWRYRGVVHEYLSCPEREQLQKQLYENKEEKDQLKEDDNTDRVLRSRKKDKKYKKDKRELRDQKEKERQSKEDILKLREKLNVLKLDNGFVLYQDRTVDDDKSLKRFSRDKILLYNEYLKNPHDARTLFYLAQTCGCLGDIEESYKYYRLRLKEGSFNEEMFHAYFRSGNTSVDLGHEWEETLMWYMKAYEYSCEELGVARAEPLIKIGEYYRLRNNWKMSYTFLKMACELSYPEHLILFVDRNDYDFLRWHLLGIVGFYAYGKNDKVGKIAAINAYISKKNELDKQNVKFYTEDDNEYNLIMSSIDNGQLKSLPSLLYHTDKVINSIPVTTEVNTLTIKEKLLQKLKDSKNERKKKGK